MDSFLSFHNVRVCKYYQRQLYLDQGKKQLTHEAHLLIAIHWYRLQKKTLKTHQNNLNYIHH